MEKPTDKFSPSFLPGFRWHRIAESYLQIGAGLLGFRRDLKEAGEQIPDGLEKKCLDHIHAHICAAMQWEVQAEGKFPDIDEDLPTLVLSNHPTIIGIWTPAQVLAEYYGWTSVGVGRESLSRVPFVGKNLVEPMKATKTGLFFDREKGKEGKRQLKEGLESVFRRGSSVWLFPDGTRPYWDRIAKDRKKWDLPWLQRTPFPSRGGFHTLVEGAKERGAFNLLNVTAAEVRDWKVGGTIGVFVKKENADEVISMTEEEKGDWLVEKWEEKTNEILEHERRH